MTDVWTELGRNFGLFIYGVLNTVGCHEQTCALRAPTGFSARMLFIRAENPVTVNSKDGVGFLYKIADCAWMANQARLLDSAHPGLA